MPIPEEESCGWNASNPTAPLELPIEFHFRNYDSFVSCLTVYPEITLRFSTRRGPCHRIEGAHEGVIVRDGSSDVTPCRSSIPVLCQHDIVVRSFARATAIPNRMEQVATRDCHARA